jgi:hypothetical protein
VANDEEAPSIAATEPPAPSDRVPTNGMLHLPPSEVPVALANFNHSGIIRFPTSTR